MNIIRVLAAFVTLLVMSFSLDQPTRRGALFGLKGHLQHIERQS